MEESLTLARTSDYGDSLLPPLKESAEAGVYSTHGRNQRTLSGTMSLSREQIHSVNLYPPVVSAQVFLQSIMLLFKKIPSFEQTLEVHAGRGGDHSWL